MKKAPRLMVGRLFLTDKYIGFHSFKVHYSGVLERPRLVPTGRVLGLPMDKVVELSVEEGVRSKRSRPNWTIKKDFERKVSGERPLNAKPRPLDSAEKYRQVMITSETENGLEVALFEVDDADEVAERIRTLRAKQQVE